MYRRRGIQVVFLLFILITPSVQCRIYALDLSICVIWTDCLNYCTVCVCVCVPTVQTHTHTVIGEGHWAHASLLFFPPFFLPRRGSGRPTSTVVRPGGRASE